MLLGDDRVLLARTEWLAAARAAIFALGGLPLQACHRDRLGGHGNCGRLSAALGAATTTLCGRNPWDDRFPVDLA